METNIFIDTSFFKALVDTQDEFNTSATTLWEKILVSQPICFTSNFILDEALTLIRKRNGLKVAQKLYALLIENGELIRITRVTSQDEQDAWQWFTKNWSGLSFTDCVSFAQMMRLGLTQVATFDHHFEQAGFTLV